MYAVSIIHIRLLSHRTVIRGPSIFEPPERNKVYEIIQIEGPLV